MVDLLVLYHWWLYKIMHKTDQNVICKSKAPTFPKCPWKEKGFSQWEDRKTNHAYQRKACCQHAEQQCPKSRQTVVHTWGLTEWHLLQTLCQHLHSPTAGACARTSDHLTKNTEEMGKTVCEANQHAIQNMLWMTSHNKDDSKDWFGCLNPQHELFTWSLGHRSWSPCKTADSQTFPEHALSIILQQAVVKLAQQCPIYSVAFNSIMLWLWLATQYMSEEINSWELSSQTQTKVKVEKKEKNVHKKLAYFGSHTITTLVIIVQSATCCTAKQCSTTLHHFGALGLVSGLGEESCQDKEHMEDEDNYTIYMNKQHFATSVQEDHTYMSSGSPTS